MTRVAKERRLKFLRCWIRCRWRFLSLIGKTSHKVGQARSVLLLTCFSAASIRLGYQLKICVLKGKEMFCLSKDKLNKQFFKMDNQPKRWALFFFFSLFYFESGSDNKVRISKCCFGCILKSQPPVHLQLITFPPNESDRVSAF